MKLWRSIFLIAHLSNGAVERLVHRLNCFMKANVGMVEHHHNVGHSSCFHIVTPHMPLYMLFFAKLCTSEDKESSGFAKT